MANDLDEELPFEPTRLEIAPMPRQSRNAEVDFPALRCSNGPRASTTDPGTRLYRKSPGAGAMLCILGHALIVHRSRLIREHSCTQDYSSGLLGMLKSRQSVTFAPNALVRQFHPKAMPVILTRP